MPVTRDHSPDPRRIIRKPRVAVVQAWYAPYRVPLFRALRAGGRIDLTVLYCAPVEKGRDWSAPPQLPYSAVFLRPRPLLHYRHRHLFGEEGAINYPQGLWRALERLRPEVVVGYEFRLECQLASLFSGWHGCGYVTWSDVTAAHDARMGRLRLFVRRLLLSRSVALIGSSTATLDHFNRNFGFSAERSFLSILSAHVGEFRRQAGASANPGTAQRESFRLLYVGRLVPLKGVDLLIAAFARIAQRFPLAELTIIGGGPQKEALMRQAERSGCGQRILFKNPLPQVALAMEMGRHDVFVFPTRMDVFGLVVAEAMACGLPVVCSCHAGAAADLMAGSGIVVDPTDVPAMAAALERLAADSGLRRQMAARAAEVLEVHNLESAANGFLAAVEAAASSLGSLRARGPSATGETVGR